MKERNNRIFVSLTISDFWIDKSFRLHTFRNTPDWLGQYVKVHKEALFSKRISFLTWSRRLRRRLCCSRSHGSCSRCIRGRQLGSTLATNYGGSSTALRHEIVLALQNIIAQYLWLGFFCYPSGIITIEGYEALVQYVNINYINYISNKDFFFEIH